MLVVKQIISIFVSITVRVINVFGFILLILNFHLVRMIREEIHILRIVVIMDIKSVITVIMFSEIIVVFTNNGFIIINTIIIILIAIITISHDFSIFLIISIDIKIICIFSICLLNCL